MTAMLEVYYTAPADSAREARLLDVIRDFGGWLDYREAPEVDGSRSICLTYEFDDWDQAIAAADHVRTLGEYVEGPCEYGCSRMIPPA